MTGSLSLASKLALPLALCLTLAAGQVLANDRDGRQQDRRYDDRRYEDRRYEDRRYDDRRNEDRRNEDRRSEQRAQISPAQAAAIVEQRYGGRVMNVTSRQGRNGPIYSVKILQSSGHMRTVNVDGQTGAILN